MPAVSYKNSMRKLVDENPEIGQEMIEGALNSILQNELDDGRILLHQYVNATLGFAELGRRMDKDPKSLMRSLGPKGNPTVTTLMGIIQTCVSAQDMAILAHVVPQAKRADHRPQLS